ncbi:TPA: hypothetical protein L4T17_002214 [Pseudomonas aeruginosa]|uniref:hypothetical protein n=1 Tax=Pseudomonas aeruginosa TaxID=287 RepID=UPI0003B9AE39|nr:hypothetical protein [Pseudomonas aeruginosa]ERV86750.1 hypothetical protein Q041_02507 [Pseudomonas aeruginosa BWHPSA028]MBG4113712.1 hypothetical protein [Pseudomonas aeruginosa]MBG6817940.1 hypothetical protein [Pseudomonas aeruginosa]MBI6936635.1 hypothetical protein [Pseudomonas aeruginosa]MBI8011971.1 hypothetical protein [Pseudomonas aeruginosa]
MTDTNKLKVWAEALVIRAGSAGPDISADVLGLIEEVEKLRADTSSMRGSLNANSKSMKKLIKDGTKVTKELDRLRAENETLRGALQAVEAEVDGNIRPLTRDLVNMVSGLKNGSHPNDIYEHCDEIERIIGAAIEGAKQ